MSGFTKLLFRVKKLRLLYQLKSLDAAELDSLQLYLESPFHNTNPHILNLFCYLKSYWPDFDKKQIDQNQMYKATFPGEAVEEGRLNHLMWKCCSVIENFFILAELKNQPEKRGSLLRKSYHDRDLRSDYEKELFKSLKSYREKQTISFADDLGRLEILNELLFQVRRNVYDNLEEGTFPVREFEEALQFVRMHGELNLHIFAKGLKKIRLDFPFKFGEDTDYGDGKNAFNKKIISQNVLLQINYLISCLYTKKIDRGDLTDFETLIDLYTDNIALFSKAEQRKLYILVQNIGAYFKMYRMDALRLTFQATKAALLNKVIGQKGNFGELTYGNIVIMATNIGETEFADKFIKEYTQNLPLNQQQRAKHYAMGFLAFARLDYEKVNYHTGQIKFKNHHWKTNAKGITIRSYYELFERDGAEWLSLLRSQLRSLDKYLNRTKGIPPILRKRFRDFHTITKKLVSRRTNVNRKAVHQQELKEILHNCKPQPTSAEWLEEKINNLL